MKTLALILIIVGAFEANAQRQNDAPARQQDNNRKATTTQTARQPQRQPAQGTTKAQPTRERTQTHATRPAPASQQPAARPTKPARPAEHTVNTQQPREGAHVRNNEPQRQTARPGSTQPQRQTTQPRNNEPQRQAAVPQREVHVGRRAAAGTTPEANRRGTANGPDRVVVSTHDITRRDFRRPQRYYNAPVTHQHHRHNKVFIAPPHAYRHIVWTPDIHRYYCSLYPTVTWHYNYGYKIGLVPSYEAFRFGGEVQSVYGRVDEVFYFPEYDYFYLYIGGIFPYQDITVIVPGYEARYFSRNPDWYFQNRYIITTGLISEYDRQPEIYISRANQISLY